MTPRVVAFDLSLTATGWADGSGAGVLTPPASVNRGVPRLQWIRAAVLERATGADVVVLEGYSFASKGRAIISLGELGGVIRCTLADEGIPSADVAPTSRAMYATGKGNAGKPEVLAAAIRSLEYSGHSFDEADALWLRAMAIAHYASDETTEYQRRALAAVEWPVIALLQTQER